MKRNMGTADRIIRMVTAAIFVALSLTGIVTGALAIILPVAGVIFGTTSFIGFCPLYTPFGISTMGEHEHDMEGDGVD
jgi:hypothetical protein